jgi:L-ascorbate metabolism protein UlaG (beta-lactamase superfamily)
MKYLSIFILVSMSLFQSLNAQFESDVISTSEGNLEMFFIGHGTLMFKFNELVIHIDPVSREADYSTLPDADLILVSHEHGDHLDMNAIGQVLKEETRIVMTARCMEQLEDFQANVFKNGDGGAFYGIEVRAIPAYNIVHKRSNGNPYHPKGAGNGYILGFGDTHVLIGGDTENIPEYEDLGMDIAVAFLPMNLPYTMSPEMVADAALAIHPKILYPYHFGDTDTGELVELLKNEKDIEVRIRDLK